MLHVSGATPAAVGANEVLGAAERDGGAVGAADGAAHARANTTRDGPPITERSHVAKSAQTALSSTCCKARLLSGVSRRA